MATRVFVGILTPVNMLVASHQTQHNDPVLASHWQAFIFGVGDCSRKR